MRKRGKGPQGPPRAWAEGDRGEDQVRVWASARGVTCVQWPAPSEGDPPAGQGSAAARRQAEQALAQLLAYLGGAEAEPAEPLDLRGLSPFAQRVLRACRRIPRGQTVTYGELARRVGHPGAARAVGQVMARNPVPLLVPCHRVVAARGLGGYGGGLARKRYLLAVERAPQAAPQPGADTETGAPPPSETKPRRRLC